ncbi:hypothetical protein MOQ_010005 [Trypanosoma cruzi marinkellei]|uniref:Uncharacterized protein n=1 Tax=Trypanosoma cruzi marinkellei TaxID=85056 RepID=K2MGQ1_TRYCR|nr:hypothetical protein MOQ_010005 [Trypanosoma cruzi marinkellei]
MRAPEPPPSNEAVRNSILAQLNTIRISGRGRHEPSEHLQSQPQHSSSFPSSPTPVSAGNGRRANMGSFSMLTTPRTRRLPPIFAEQRQNTATIRHVCGGLNEVLQKLDLDFAHVGGKIRAAIATDDVFGRPDMPGAATMRLLQLRSRRQFLARLRRTPPRERISTEEDTRKGDALEELHDEINRARLAAADEGLSDEQSVSDYAEEPDVPRFVPDSRLRDEVEAMEASLRKISECVTAMSAIENCDAGQPWWESAMRTREMKALGIRANYHARSIIKWNQRAREHFLVEAVTSNEQMERCRTDMLYLREQQDLFQKRIELCHEEQASTAEEMKALQEMLYDINRLKSELQQQLLGVAHERRLLPAECEDAKLAELVLLLEHVNWPAWLLPDVECVKEWVRENATPLDV